MLALGNIAGLAGPPLRIGIVSTGLFVTLCQMLHVGFTAGAGFRNMLVNGLRIPLYAGFPVGYLETSRLLLKYTAIQFPFIVVFATAWSAALAWLGGFSLVAAGLVGFKLAFLVVSVRCIHIVMAFSSSTNEQTRIKFRGLLMVASCLGLGLSFLALGGIGLFYPWWPVAIAAWLLAMLDAYALLRFYGWYYHRNRFDLVNTRAGR